MHHGQIRHSKSGLPNPAGEIWPHKNSSAYLSQKIGPVNQARRIRACESNLPNLSLRIWPLMTNSVLWLFSLARFFKELQSAVDRHGRYDKYRLISGKRNYPVALEQYSFRSSFCAPSYLQRIF